jgi:putative hemolysin
VGDVMVPRQVVVAISRRAPPDEVRRVLLEETHSRMPVYEDRIDNIVGYVSVKDMLSMAWEQQLIVLEDVMRPPYFVPESSRAVDLLKEMRRRHTPFAIVVDAGGGMSGIVTMEDLLEELVGEIFSEHARDMPPPIAPDPDGSVVLPGTTAVREVNRQLGTELPEDARWTTVAGLCLSVAGRIPRKGEVFTLASGATIEVVEATERRVLELRLVPPGGLSAPASPAGTPGKTSPPRPRSGSR